MSSQKSYHEVLDCCIIAADYKLDKNSRFLPWW